MPKIRKTLVRFTPDEGVILVDDGRVTAEMWIKRFDDALKDYAKSFRRVLRASIKKEKKDAKNRRA